jgi:hypothetical protein
VIDVRSLIKKLNEIGVEIIFMELENTAYYIPELKFIFVNQELDEFQMRIAIYHELKHSLDHDLFTALYKNNVYHSKLEAEADEYMLREIIKDFDGYYNYSQLMEEFNLKLGWDVKFAK